MIGVRGETSEQVSEGGNEVTIFGSKETVVSDFDETPGQHMLEKPPDEFMDMQGEMPFPITPRL